MQKIYDLCRTHQGDMPAGALAAQPVSGPAAWFAPPGIKPLFTGSRIVQWSLVILALWGVALAGEMYVSNVAYLCMHILLAVAAFVLIIAGLARTAGHRRTGALLGVLWSSLVLLTVSALAAFIVAIVVMIPMTEPPAKPTLSGNGSFNAVVGAPTADRILIAMAQYNLDRAGGFGWLIIALGITGTALGLAGLPLAAKKPSAAPSPA